MDQTVRLWNVETGKEEIPFKGHTLAVNSVALSPDGRRALTGGEDKTVRLWDLETRKEKHRFSHRRAVNSVVVSMMAAGLCLGVQI
jgi:WD40 repeat protein